MKPTAEQVRQWLRYDQDTGVLTWALNRRNARAGTRAGSERGSSGYRVVSLGNCAYYEHRVAWLWMTGEWPKEQIDHINGDRFDNRWANIREVSQTVNQQNKRRATVRSSLGLLGASPPQGKGRTRFKSTIGANGRSIHLGYHDTPEQAHEAYVEAKRRLHAGGTI